MQAEVAVAAAAVLFVVAVGLLLAGFADWLSGSFKWAKNFLTWLYRSGGRRRKVHRVLTSPGGRVALVVSGLVGTAIAVATMVFKMSMVLPSIIAPSHPVPTADEIADAVIKRQPPSVAFQPTLPRTPIARPEPSLPKPPEAAPGPLPVQKSECVRSMKFEVSDPAPVPTGGYTHSVLVSLDADVEPVTRFEMVVRGGGEVESVTSDVGGRVANGFGDAGATGRKYFEIVTAMNAAQRVLVTVETQNRFFQVICVDRFPQRPTQ